MSNSQISQLPSATTPLAGTETLPVVQSSTTNKTAVSTIKDYILGLANTFTANQIIQTTSSTASKITLVSALDGSSNFQSGFEVRRTTVSGGALMQSSRNAAIGGVGWMVMVTTNNAAEVSATYTNTFQFDQTGNLIPQIAGKGVNFTANTPASGMTSQNLTWYEEGTWTPAQGSGLTVVGAFSSTGKYTRIGREVIISATVTGATSVAVSAAGIITNNLPFTVGTAGHGNATNAAVNAFAAVICTTTNVTSAGVIASTGTITFSATYFV